MPEASSQEPPVPTEEARERAAGEFAVGERLARMEALLAQVLRELHARRRGSAKRGRTVGERATQAAARDMRHVPNEFDKAAARRALRRYG